MKKQFLGTSDGQMVISNFRQPQIGACNKADFTIVNRIKTGQICLGFRYSCIRQPLGVFAELEVDGS